MAVAILAGCVTQWPIGRIADRMDRRKVVIAVWRTGNSNHRCHGGGYARRFA